jgi:hypothetical protein
MHMHHHSRSATRIVVSGNLVGAVSLFIVAVVMWVMAAIFFVVAQSQRVLYTPFTTTAVGLGALGVLMVIIGIVMLVRYASEKRLTAGGVPKRSPS